LLPYQKMIDRHFQGDEGPAGHDPLLDPPLQEFLPHK